MRNRTIFVVTVTIAFIIVGFLTLERNNIYAEKEEKNKIQSFNLDDYLVDDFYVNFDGKLVNKDAMKERIYVCVDMKNKNLISLNVNCIKWSLSAEGNMKILDYIIEDVYGEGNQEEFLEDLMDK